MRRTRGFIALLGLFASASGCELPPAHGDANAFIVGASPALWAEVEDVFLEAMQPTIRTVRDELPFRITHQEPEELESWGLLRRFRQVLVLGVESDRWIAYALAELEEPPPPAPAVLQVLNVWARGQQVSILLLPESGQVAAVRALAQELHEILDTQFRAYAMTRMFISGEDVALQDSLAQNTGFSLLIPTVYQYSTRDSIFRFRNDNPSPAELIREISVSWHTPGPEADPTAVELQGWRDTFSAEYYNDPQVVDTLLASYRPVHVNGLSGVEYQAAWINPPGGWPAGGPFIARALRCPVQDRVYLLDAWLYAPGRDKYEYMIQLQTILDSFRCR